MKRLPFSFLGLYSTVLMMIATLYMTFAATPAYAQVQHSVSATTPTAVNGHVTIIILDMSGSMAQNDPTGVRCSATNAYIDLSGPGDFIGVVGLDNNNGKTGDPHNYQVAQWSIDPTEMDTRPHRQALRREIASESKSCKPDQRTPTYDSLYQALNMLNQATNVNGKHYSGSLILLTDGLPCGNDACTDGNQQVTDIRNDLLPQFRHNNWPIDTIALGKDADFGFLTDMANAAGGRPFSDVDTSGNASPLNIMPFFIDIFKMRIGRTPGPEIPAVNLSDTGGSRSSDFQIGDFVDHLDIIAVKDNQNTTVVLRDPNGREVSSRPDVDIEEDIHYKIYLINGPQQGDWQLTATGSGGFLMNGLITSQFTVSIVSPAQNSPVWPLGQGLTISAQIFHQNSQISGTSFTVRAAIKKDEIIQQTRTLSDRATPGTYQGEVLVPESSSPGSYTITVSISQVTDTPIASADRSIRFQIFPQPSFLSPTTGLPTNDAVDGTAVRWDPLLQILYGIPVGIVQWLNQGPLQGLPAQPKAVLTGVIQKQGQPYDLQSATINASAQLDGSKELLPAEVIAAGGDRFNVLFQPPSNGNYIVTFQTSGSFADSHGDLWTTTRRAHLTIQPATFAQELRAWSWTVLYIAFLIFVFFLIKFVFTPAPFGEWVAIEDGDTIGRHSFNRSRRNLFQAFFARNILESHQASLPSGVQLRFRGRVIEVRPSGRASEEWRRGDGSELRPTFQPTSDLRYHPGRDATGEEPATYMLIAQTEREQQDNETYDDDSGYDTTSTRGRKGAKKPRTTRKSSDRRPRDEDEYYEDYN